MAQCDHGRALTEEVWGGQDHWKRIDRKPGTCERPIYVIIETTEDYDGCHWCWW